MPPEPLLIKSIQEARDWSRAVRKSGQLGFVPTMGALHTGHAQLMIEAAAECDYVAVSIFVNPTQFGPHEDLAKYPRTLEADLELCQSIGVHAVFLPTENIMYPCGKEGGTAVEVPSLSTIFEGAIRPGHFSGVATVVTKLFGIIQPDLAYFGRKDYQQWLVIKKMTEDLNLPVDLRRVDTVREADGLAMSSRNRYLDADQRAVSLSLSRALQAAVDLVKGGETRVSMLETAMQNVVSETALIQLDYARVVNADNLKGLELVDCSLAESAVALIAARVGTTRLIDNVMLPPK